MVTRISDLPLRKLDDLHAFLDGHGITHSITLDTNHRITIDFCNEEDRLWYELTGFDHQSDTVEEIITDMLAAELRRGIDDDIMASLIQEARK